MYSTISRICANAIWASPEERTVLKAVEKGGDRTSEGNAMRCNKCWNESSTGRKFCATCGSPLSSRCHSAQNFLAPVLSVPHLGQRIGTDVKQRLRWPHCAGRRPARELRCSGEPRSGAASQEGRTRYGR